MIRLPVPASLVGPAGKRFKCSWNGQHECVVAGLLAGADGYQACWTEPSISVAPSGWAFAVSGRVRVVLPTTDFPRSSAGSTRAGPRRSSVGLQESEISNASTGGSRLDANGQGSPVG